MFRGLINDAKAAAGSLVAKYLARASVAVPFVVGLGFATAAVTLMLVERFGGVIASWIIAGGFTLIGLVATLAVTVKEQEEEVADEQAQKHDTMDAATDVAAQAAAQAPLALMGALLSTPMGPGAVAGGAKMIARNIPLVVLLVLLAMLFWPSGTSAADSESAEVDEPEFVPKPNGVHPSAEHFRSEAA
jgi:hypothetical protein